jgi:hypothetical protein
LALVRNTTYRKDDHRGQNPENGDNDEQLDEGEAVMVELSAFVPAAT